MIPKFLCVVSTIIGATSLFAQDFTVTGTITGMPDSTKIVLINTELPDDQQTLAESYSQKGVFTLKGTVKHPTLAQISVQPLTKDGTNRYRHAAIPLMVENCSYTVESILPYDSIGRMSYTQDAFKLKGGKAQEEYELYERAVHQASRAAQDASYLQAHKWFETNADEDTTRLYKALTKQKEDEFTRQRMAFVKQNPALPVSAIIAGQEMIKQYNYSGDEIREMYETVACCENQSLMALVRKMRDFGLKFCKMMPLKDFTAQDPEGNDHTFSTLRDKDKYVFIDFWASWCGPCRQAIPHVKELHEKYGDRMQIISVSVDEKDAAWRKAMEKEKMDWTQLWFADQEKMGDLARAINLSSIPRLLLINGNDEIVCSTNSPDEITEAIVAHLGE